MSEFCDADTRAGRPHTVVFSAAKRDSIRQIARKTGHSRNTVRSIVREGAPRSFRTPPRPSKLDPFKDYLRQRFEEFGLSGVRLSQEIRKMGFGGSVRIVCRFLHELRKKVPSELTTRFETPPGEQAQVDWAEAGRYQLADVSSARIFLFVMVLGFCRALYIEFTRSMRLESLIRCHQNAFALSGGNLPLGVRSPSHQRPWAEVSSSRLFRNSMCVATRRRVFL
jgi:transposase